MLATLLLGGMLGFVAPYVGPAVIYPTVTKTPTLVPTATRTPTSRPPVCAGDADLDGTVTVDELIRAINAAMEGCPQ